MGVLPGARLFITAPPCEPSSVPSPRKKTATTGPKGDVRIEYVPLAKLLRWPGNPKEHAVDAIEDSVGRFGFVDPFLVDEGTGRLVAGHGRLETLERLRRRGESLPKRVRLVGKDWHVPVIRGIAFENEREAEAYLLATNKLVEDGGWNPTLAAKMLSRHLTDLRGTGWKSSEVEALTASVKKALALNASPPTNPDQPPADFPSFGADSKATHPCPACGFPVVCDA